MVARWENSACLAVTSYTYAPSREPASASWWEKSACSSGRPVDAEALAVSESAADTASPQSRIKDFRGTRP